MRESGRFFAGVSCLASVLLTGIALGWLCAAGCAARPTLDYPLMQQALAVIQGNYVDRSAVKPTPLTYGAISGMVDSLGDFGHSAFLSPDMVKQLRNIERGELKGIGVEIQMKAGNVVVVAPLDNSPAERKTSAG